MEEPNWFDYQEFYKNISQKPYNIFVELGVWLGHSISFLAQNINRKDVIIYAVDLFDESYEFKDLTYLEGRRYEIFCKNTKKYENIIKPIKSYSWEAANNFSNNSVDFVFVDADHSYESVVKDIDAWLPKIKNQGIISGHDYFNPCGVKKAVDEKFRNKTKFCGSCWYVDIN